MTRYILSTDRKEMLDEWQAVFGQEQSVKIFFGDILSLPCGALVSPANSRGWMDGGLDREISRFFNWEIETIVMGYLEQYHDGFLPVGQAVIVETQDNRIPYLVVAPTMESPMPVAETTNAYLAMKATLKAVEKFNSTRTDPITSVAIPAFCAGVGMMPLATVAWQMKRGWDDFHKKVEPHNQLF